jgi:hypothetical protein
MWEGKELDIPLWRNILKSLRVISLVDLRDEMQMKNVILVVKYNDDKMLYYALYGLEVCDFRAPDVDKLVPCWVIHFLQII